MTPEQYRKLLGWYEQHPKAKQLTLLLNHWLPAIPFVCFPLLIVLLNIQWFGLFGSGTGRDILDFMPQIARARHQSSAFALCRAGRSVDLPRAGPGQRGRAGQRRPSPSPAGSRSRPCARG